MQISFVVVEDKAQIRRVLKIHLWVLCYSDMDVGPSI